MLSIRNNENQIPQEQMHWGSSELAKILYFINENFDRWYNNNYNLCVEAKEATGVTWDANSINNKVYDLFKIMDEYLRKGIKSTECTVIWENDIYRLVKEIYFKTKKKMNWGDQGIARNHRSNGHIEKILNIDQVTIEARIDKPCSLEELHNLCDEKIQKVNNWAETSKEKVKADYKEQINQISQIRSELIGKINETNKIYEEFRKF
ncbi:hypothetical protein RclHR1_08280002 [Rhizophagus clarus]|uniref:Uncharacterized protein n=1 Tax=Rhizophagus clarus TaxID=94130 RepID=A0A2Z6S0G5_9GLOM|nr:hypothetical protein RclHR1_08280002 [Rhizophagus clarus]GES79993.1 hypothetical protein GLOIN_2v1722846 [Rhizophagus clarus]